MAIAQGRLDELWDFADPQASESRLRRAADEETDAEARWGTREQVEWAEEALAEARAALDPPGP